MIGCVQFGKSGDCRGASPLCDIPNGAHRQWDLLGHVHRVCRRVWSACFFRGSNAPSTSDRWAVEGVHSNYYAITHKPIDLDWTPGGRAARSRARPDLLQDQARNYSTWYIQRDFLDLQTRFSSTLTGISPILAFIIRRCRIAEDFYSRVLHITKNNI